mmetsp:Transcript_21199/g.25213  ORF Transcript_21199/g.25213 Transcript_21199/m.25213 type:complete len:126 (+) Transcript_21199:349-726(+)
MKDLIRHDLFVHIPCHLLRQRTRSLIPHRAGLAFETEEHTLQPLSIAFVQMGVVDRTGGPRGARHRDRVPAVEGDAVFVDGEVVPEELLDLSYGFVGIVGGEEAEGSGGDDSGEEDVIFGEAGGV